MDPGPARQAGPDDFDCSGLIVYAYAQAGMSGQPHPSAEQSTLASR